MTRGARQQEWKNKGIRPSTMRAFRRFQGRVTRA